MTLSGRRPNDRANRIGKSILEGLSAFGTILADGPKLSRIEAIDKEIKELQQERDHLIAELIEPYDLKVSENYDPHWRKAADEDDAEDVFSPIAYVDGRLTKCKGRDTMGSYHDAHPGCPYIDKRHNAHEFTLRD